MTLHCAITYFDPETKSMGYLLGSDCRAVAKQPERPSEEEVFSVDKSFKGKKTVGFIRGTLNVSGESAQESFSGALESLERAFDDIDEGVDYSGVSVLSSSRYVLLIGKKSLNALELYTVSNQRDREKNMAQLMFRLTPKMYSTEDHTRVWYSPNSRDYFVIEVSEKLDVNRARDFLEKMLAVPDAEVRELLSIKQGSDLGIPNIYQLDFQGIKKI